MTDGSQNTDDAQPTTEELEEPSVEKDADEEPEAPADTQPEPSHEAVGIGVIDAPQADAE